jgi:hypothetical protein
MKGILCRYCGEVHWNRATCAKRQQVAEGRAPTVQTDENWSRFGMVEPGFNGNRPLESRAAFEAERKAKGMEIVTVGELKNARPRDPVRDQERQVEALAEKYQRA